MTIGLDAAGVAHERDAGSVRLLGSALEVALPPDMSGTAARRLTTRLEAHAGGRTARDGRTVTVPVRHADRLRRELTDVWPGSQWVWAWSASATRSSVEAEDDARRLAAAAADGADPVDGETLTTLLTQGGFTRTLLDAQVNAVSRLVSIGSGGNFSVPGSGKTTMTLATYAALRQRGQVDRLLVVAPLSAHEAWREELEACFASGCRPPLALRPSTWPRTAEVVVLNYERAAAAATGGRFDRWAAGHGVLVVFDEAHRAKRGSAGRHGAAAATLARRAHRRLVLTGTPMPNDQSDLATVLDLAWPGHGPELAAAERASRAGPSVWVRLTKDDLGVSPPEIRTEQVRLDDAHRKVYEIVARQAAVVASDAVLFEYPELARHAVMRTLAVATNPATLADTSLRWDNVDAPVPEAVLAAEADLQALVAASRPAKLLRAAELAKEHAEDGRKLLVWTSFLVNVTELTRLLAPYGVAVVTGDTAVEDETAETDRVRELHRFRYDRDTHVLIATPQTLGEGVSLHKVCQSQVHVDRTFNAGMYLQALDRTHRVGMPTGTTARATVLVARDTLDVRLDAVLRRKIGAMRQVLADHSLEVLSLPDDGLDVATPAEMVRLLTDHLR